VSERRKQEARNGKGRREFTLEKRNMFDIAGVPCKAIQ